MVSLLKGSHMVMSLLKQYEIWLLLVSLGCLIAERIKPWRHQPLVRPLVFQDYFWLFFNGNILSLVIIILFKKDFLITPAFDAVLSTIYGVFDSIFLQIAKLDLHGVKAIVNLPMWMQIPIYLVIADFTEWCIHNALHRVNWLWKFHRVHHSIKEMDWIGNFRFHWFETLLYNSAKYVPITLLGAGIDVVLIVAVFSTAIGHLNHANLAISWGPLRYIFNSAKMHIWHHEKALRGKAGTNFGIVFSIWDWLFKTAYMPLDKQPEEIGFKGEEQFPDNLAWRFFLPFLDKKVASVSQ